SQQGLSADEATCQLIIFGLPCDRAPVPFLEGESVRRYDDIAPLGKLRSIRLIRFTGEADDLTLAKVELPGMLMVSNYSWRLLAGIFRNKNKRFNALRFFNRILDGLANVSTTIHVAQYCWI